MMEKSDEILLALIRIALGNDADLIIPDDVDWKDIYELSIEHGVTAICADGLQKIYDNQPELETKFYINNESINFPLLAVTTAIEHNYQLQKQTILQLSSFLSSKDIPMLIIKGVGLSLNYPIPSHRLSSDIDIYTFDKGEYVDEMVFNRFGSKVLQNGDKHSTFVLNGFTIENHVSIVNDNIYPSLKFFNEYLIKELMNYMTIEMDGIDVHLPSALFNALFIPFHSASHFVHGEASIRHLCDWACFVKRFSSEVDWIYVEHCAKQFGFWEFYRCFNGIVHDYFGINYQILPDWQCDKHTEKRIYCEYVAARKNVNSLIGKIYRYYKSFWRFKLVYKDNFLFSAFRLAKAYLRLRSNKMVSVWDTKLQK